MANLYSDHFSATSGSASIDNPRPLVPAGLSHGKLRYKAARITGIVVGNGVATDVMRFLQLKSSDRLIELYTSGTNTGTSLGGNWGVYLEGDGAVQDVDLFDAGAAQNDVTKGDRLLDGAVTADYRGKPLWEMVNLGGSLGLTEDPQVI
ncbi:MAG TPA: hypothetical protein VM223_11280, partial [Planctomycetota bacterium]|nr:hypothetical protein [Planctomycetota bacterium]